MDNVELIIRVRTEGQAALAALRQAMGGLNSDVKNTASGVAQLDAVELKLSGTLKLVTNATNEATNAHKKNTDSMSDSVLKGILLSEALGRVSGAFKTVTIESAIYASRTQQLNIVMDQLARTNGLNVASVRAQADAVKALGITTQESRSTIATMIFAQLDLAKATDLARLAQNAAKIAGISSSEALAGIINGIRTQQVEVLRTYGIQVSFEQALARGAARLGKTVETLTDYERANITLNEVLSKGPRILGVYEASLTTTGGQMQSLTRLVDEAKNAIGERFAPALQRVIEFLTNMAIGIKDNADQAAYLATALTSAGLAAATFRFTPGPIQVKAAAAAIVGGGSYLLGNTDAETAQIDGAKNAIAKIEKDRKDLIRQVQNGRITDKAAYLREDQRLKDLELQIEKNLTEALALEYKKRRENAGKGSFEIQFPDSGLPRIARGDKDRAPFQSNKETIPKDIDLGTGRRLSAATIEEAIKNTGKEEPFDSEGLKFTPDKKSGIDSQFAQFQQRLREAQKSANSALERANAADLFGVEKIAAERAAAFRRIAEDFKPFDESLRAGAEFQRLLGTIAKEFDLILEKEKRSQQVDKIKNVRRISDTESQIQIDRIKQQAQQAQEIANISAKPGNEEVEINRLRKQRLELALLEAQASRARNASDLQAARDIFALNQDRKLLDEAIINEKIASLKTEAQLRKEQSEIEQNAQVAILKLRKEQAKEIERAYENARKIAETEASTGLNRLKDTTSRAIRLAQANALPGNERAVQEFELRARVSIAQEEYQLTKESLEAQRKQAIEEYEKTRDKVELERRSTEIRQAELRANYQLEKEILDARVDREIQISGIRRKQTEELRQSLGQLYDAARTAGRTGIKEFAQGYFEQFKKTVFVNIGEELFRGASQKLGGIIPGQEKIDPVTGKGTGELTTLGRILRGTPLGVDPAKLAIDKQINAQDRNTKAVDRLSDILNGRASGGSAPSIGGLGGGGSLLDQIIGGSLGAILGIPGGGVSGIPGVIIKNSFPGGSNFAGEASRLDLRPDRGLGGLLTRVTGFLGPKVDPATGKAKFSAGATALAAAAAIPGILAGLEEGGLKGTLGVSSGALGVAASIPGPQQPFLIAASLFSGLLGGILKSKKQKKEEDLARALSNKFSLPDSIERVEDLAGNAIDYNSRGEIRTFAKAGGATSIQVNISAMDAKSFQDRGPEIADSIMNMLQLGHPLRGQVGEIAGVS